MSPVGRVTRRTSLAATLFVAAGCASARTPADTGARVDQRLSESERVAHVLSRLTFGPRTGDAERVAKMGVDRWIDQQLRPE